MKLITWTPIVYSEKGFPRLDGKPYLPKSTIEEAIRTAFVFYHTKKDKQVRSRIYKLMTSENMDTESFLRSIEEIVFNKHLLELSVKDVMLPSESIFLETVEVYSPYSWKYMDDFRTEIFYGTLEVPVQTDDYEKLRYACLSFSRSLARMELDMIEDEHLRKFYEELTNDMNTSWYIPLRIGMWSYLDFRGYLLYFWNLKLERENIERNVGRSILPERLLFLPRRRVTPGWSELNKEV